MDATTASTVAAPGLWGYSQADRMTAPASQHSSKKKFATQKSAESSFSEVNDSDNDPGN